MCVCMCVGVYICDACVYVCVSIGKMVGCELSLCVCESVCVSVSLSVYVSFLSVVSLSVCL